jgi:uncharacterized protein (DUF1499 family)
LVKRYPNLEEELTSLKKVLDFMEKIELLFGKYAKTFNNLTLNKKLFQGVKDVRVKLHPDRVNTVVKPYAKTIMDILNLAEQSGNVTLINKIQEITKSLNLQRLDGILNPNDILKLKSASEILQISIYSEKLSQFSPELISIDINELKKLWEDEIQRKNKIIESLKNDIKTIKASLQ